MLRGSGGLLDSFLVGLQWEWRGQSNDLSLFSKRENFPSWSWTGWENASDYPPDELMAANSHNQPVETKVCIELPKETIIPWADFESQVVQRPSHTWTSPYIWIQAWSLKFLTRCGPVYSSYGNDICEKDKFESGKCVMTKRK